MKRKKIKRRGLMGKREGSKLRFYELSGSSYPILPPAKKRKMLCLPPGNKASDTVSLRESTTLSREKDMAHNLPVDEYELLAIIK